jgi:hypothetical protein
MMKTPEQRRTPIISFRWMLSFTVHSRGTGIETISMSVLGLRQMYSRFWWATNNLHNVEHHQGEIISNRERTSFYSKSDELYYVHWTQLTAWVRINLPIPVYRSTVPPDGGNDTEICEHCTDLRPDNKLSLPKTKPRNKSANTKANKQWL